MSLDDRLRGFDAGDEHLDVEKALAVVHRKAARAIVVRRAGVAAIAAAALTAAITVPLVLAARENRSEQITPGPQPSSPQSFTCNTATKQGPLVAYTEEGDLWLYDVKRDDVKRLTDDGPERSGNRSSPNFLGNGCVVYVSSHPAAIAVLSIEGGPSRTIIEEEGWIMDLDVSPDGSTLLYLHIHRDSTYQLKRLSASGGVPSVLRTFAPNPGRGASTEDEVSVAWSPDGATILAVNTHAGLENEPDIFLLDEHGRDVFPPWRGTHARWSPDGRRVYYRGSAGDYGTKELGWRAFDISSRRTTTIGMRAGTNNLAISPDGRYAAYDTSYFGDMPIGALMTEGAPVTYLYDLRTGKETLLKKSALSALWISTSEVVVTNARRPRGLTLNSFESLGTVTKITVNERQTEVSMTSTLWDAAVLLAD